MKGSRGVGICGGGRSPPTDAGVLTQRWGAGRARASPQAFALGRAPSVGSQRGSVMPPPPPLSFPQTPLPQMKRRGLRPGPSHLSLLPPQAPTFIREFGNSRSGLSPFCSPLPFPSQSFRLSAPAPHFRPHRSLRAPPGRVWTLVSASFGSAIWVPFRALGKGVVQVQDLENSDHFFLL